MTPEGQAEQQKPIDLFRQLKMESEADYDREVEKNAEYLMKSRDGVVGKRHGQQENYNFVAMPPTNT